MAEIKTKFTADTTGLKTGVESASSMVSSLKTAIGAAAIIGASMKIGEYVKEMAVAAEALDKFAAKQGMSAKAVQQLEKALIPFDMELADIDSSIAALTKKMVGSDDAGSKFATSLNKIGLSQKNLNQMKPEERFRAVALALSKVKDESKRAELGIQLFGKGYEGAVANLVAKGPNSISKAFEEASRKPIVSDESIKSLADLEDAIKTLRSSFSTAGMEAAGPLAKAVANSLNEAADTLDRMSKDGTFAKWGEQLGTIANKAIEIFISFQRFFTGRSLWSTILDLGALKILMSSASNIIKNAMQGNRQEANITAPSIVPVSTGTAKTSTALTTKQVVANMERLVTLQNQLSLATGKSNAIIEREMDAIIDRNLAAGKHATAIMDTGAKINDLKTSISHLKHEMTDMSPGRQFRDAQNSLDKYEVELLRTEVAYKELTSTSGSFFQRTKQGMQSLWQTTGAANFASNIMSQLRGALTSPLVWVAAYQAVSAYRDYVYSTISQLEEDIAKKSISPVFERSRNLEEEKSRLKDIADQQKFNYEAAMANANETGNAALESILKQINALKDVKSAEKDIGDEIKRNADRRSKIADEIKKLDTEEKDNKAAIAKLDADYKKKTTEKSEELQKEAFEKQKERIKSAATFQRKYVDELRAKWKTAASDLDELSDIPTEVLRQLAAGAGSAVTALRQQGVAKNWETGQSEFLKSIVAGKYSGPMSDQQKAAYLQSYAQKMLAIRVADERASRSENVANAMPEWKSKPEVDNSAEEYITQRKKLLESENEIKKARTALIEEDNKLAQSTTDLITKQEEYNTLIANSTKQLQNVMDLLSKSSDPEIAKKFKTLSMAMLDANDAMIMSLKDLTNTAVDSAKSIIDASKSANRAREEYEAQESKNKKRAKEIDIGEGKTLADQLKSGETKRQLERVGLDPSEITSMDQLERAKKAASAIQSMENAPQKGASWMPWSGQVLSDEQRKQIESEMKIRDQIKKENEARARDAIARGEISEMPKVPNVNPIGAPSEVYKEPTKLGMPYFGEKLQEQQQDYERQRLESEFLERERAKKNKEMDERIKKASMLSSINNVSNEKYGAIATGRIQNQNIAIATNSDELLKEISNKLDNVTMVKQYGA